jgi:hypothetical protein
MKTQEWEAYCAAELPRATEALARQSITLEPSQVHAGGERHLMTGSRDVGGGGYKLVLIGRDKYNRRVVAKVSSTEAGKQEIERERHCRQTLSRLDFAIRTFHAPQELYFGTTDGLLLFITEYIEQPKGILEHPLSEQFFIALRILETQEGVHATTHKHAKTIKEVFGMVGADEYIRSYGEFARRARENDPGNERIADLLTQGADMLSKYRTSIERYCGFLTHADFVPNNMRIHDHTVYLLDYASIHFGNKYESWARFLNYMVHHSPALEAALSAYVRENRGEEEHQNLRLMRIFKLGFLLAYHTHAKNVAEGDLHALSSERVAFWCDVLACVLHDTPVEPDRINTYLRILHSLRTPEERARQKEMLG